MRVVRGYILPIRRDNTFLCSEIINENEAKNLFNDFKNMIRLVVEDFAGRKKITSAEEFNTLLDAIVLYIKSLLYLDPIPGVIGSAASGLYTYYKAIKFFPINEPYSIEKMNELYDKLNRVRRIFVKSELYDEKAKEKIFELLKFPADTRPACNSSSLIVHSLTVSAFASSLYLEKKKDDANFKELAILRLASIFHDIGKMFDWSKHESVSSEFVQDVFGAYVEKDAEQILVNAIKLIEKSPGFSINPLYQVYKHADCIASNIDRVKSLLLKVITQKPDLKEEFEKKIRAYSNDFTKNLETLFYELFDDWDFWNNYLDLDYVKKLTEEFCMTASKISSDNPILAELEKETSAQIIDDEVTIVRIDMRGIQSYIRSNDLRTMIGGSRLVDFLTYEVLPSLFIDKLGLCPEAILYSGGGNITLLIPKSKLSQIEVVKKIVKEEYGIDISIGSSPLYDDFTKINRSIDVELSKNKLIGYITESEANLNIFQVCSYCGKGYASKTIGEGRDFVCELCSRKYEFGNTIHFKEKCKSLDINFDDISSGIIEYISGHRVEDVRYKSIERYYNVALIRFDANLASQIMASCISFTDALERSIRIDYSVKKALLDFLNIMKFIDKEHYNRLVLGTMYIGGDDGCLLVPSILAVPLALFLLNEYYLNMGGKSTLSIGIVASKPKHPISLLYSSSGWLLEKAKSNTRKLAFHHSHNAIVKEPSNKFRGAIMFFVTDGSNVSEEVLDSILKEVYDENLSLQYSFSYVLSDMGEFNSIFRLLNNIEQYYDLNLNSLDKNSMEKVIRSSISESKLINEDLEEEIRNLRRILLRSINVSISGESELNIRILFSIKEKEKRGMKEKEKISKIVSNLFSLDDEVKFALYDLYQVIKLIGGGVI